MSKKKKKGYLKFSKESNILRPQEIGMMLYIHLSDRTPIRDDRFKIIMRPGMPKAIKIWIKKNGTKVDVTVSTSEPMYLISKIPIALKKNIYQQGATPGYVI